MHGTSAAPGLAPLPSEAVLKRLTRRDSRRQIALTLPALLLVGVALFVPLAWLLYQSFVAPGGYTLDHYREIFERPAYLGYLMTTFQLSLMSTLLCILLAYPICYAMVMLRRG